MREQARATTQLTRKVGELASACRKAGVGTTMVRLESYGNAKGEGGPPRGIPADCLVSALRIRDPAKECPRGIGTDPQVQAYVANEEGARAFDDVKTGKEAARTPLPFLTSSRREGGGAAFSRILTCYGTVLCFESSHGI